MTQVILYTSEDGKSQIQLRADGQTVWLTQMEMAELLSATKQNISLHLKNVFADGELSEDSVVKDSLTTAADGKSYRVAPCFDTTAQFWLNLQSNYDLKLAENAGGRKILEEVRPLAKAA